MNELQIFKYQDKQIRTVERNGEPWWVLKDVCEVLEINNHKMTAQRLDVDEVSQTDPAKAPYQISEYLEYCDCVGKQPNQFVIEQLDIYLKSPRSKPRNREENEAEAIQKIKLLSPFERAAIVEIMEFFVWKNQRKKSHIA